MLSIALSSCLLIHVSVSFVLRLNPSNVFFSSIITFVWYFVIYFIFVEVLSVFIHSYPKIS